MISADLLIKILKACFPLTFIIAICIAIGVSSKKNKRIIASDPLSGMRMPTDEEADLIRKQVSPRVIRQIIAGSIFFVPVTVIIAGVVYTNYIKGDNFSTWVMGFLCMAVLLMYIGLMSQPLSDIRALRNKLYKVSDCHIADINIYTRYARKSHIPVEIHHATIKDAKGYLWETDLPKDLYHINESTKCLVIIFDDEEKINRSRKNGHYIFRRQVYVPYG